MLKKKMREEREKKVAASIRREAFASLCNPLLQKAEKGKGGSKSGSPCLRQGSDGLADHYLEND